MIAALIVVLAAAMPVDVDQFCEDQTDVTELADLSPACKDWLWEGDTCAESDEGCPGDAPYTEGRP